LRPQAAPWDYDWSGARAHAEGGANRLVAESAEYQESAPEPEGRQGRSRIFPLADDPREQAVRRGDWVIGDGAFCPRVSQSRGRPIRGVRGRLRQQFTGGQLQILPQPDGSKALRQGVTIFAQVAARARRARRQP
jgi:hypothetical protein